MYLKLLSYFLLTFSFTLIFSCKEKQKTVKPIEVSFTKEGTLTLYKAESDSIIKQLDIEIADTDFELQTGLMYRNGMAENHAMLFVFPTEQERYFYMKNTRFPLDIIYLNAAQKIVSFQKNAQPYNETSLPSNVPAQYVLEVSTGLADQWGLAVGDRMAFERDGNEN